MRKPIEQQTKAYFMQRQLTTEQLVAVQEKLAKKQRINFSDWVSDLIVHHKFMLASVLLVMFVWLFFPYERFNPVYQVSQEIVFNHIKDMPLEMEADNVGALRQHFVKLDFSLLESSLMAKRGWHIKGGRYCSVKGEMAVQLHYFSPAQKRKRMSLYQVAYDKHKHGDIPDIDKQQQPMVVYERGYRVELWREKGVLMACVTREKEQLAIAMKSFILSLRLSIT